MISIFLQFYNLLKTIVEKVLSNKCAIFDDNLLVKCDYEECCCSLIINTVFNNFSLQESFSTQSSITNSKLQQNLFSRKRKHDLHSKTTCNSLLVCELITTCLKVEPHMIKVSCLRFYFDKIIEMLTAQDFSYIIASSGNVYICMFKVIPGVYSSIG